MASEKLQELIEELSAEEDFRSQLGQFFLDYFLNSTEELEDLKRIAFKPLLLKNADRALEQELIMDENGVTYTKKDGKIVSSVAEVINQIKEGDILDLTKGSNYIVANNRFVYRFYFINGIVRLDPCLSYPAYAKYFRIRDVNENNRYYVHQLTEVDKPANAIDTFKDNEIYFVEFYNSDKDLISNMIFTAKFAPSVIIDDGDLGKVFSHIEVTTNKSTMYLDEDPDSFLIRVIAHYDDGSTKDVTESSKTYINRDNFTTDTVGIKEIKVIYLYDVNTGKTATESVYVNVVEEVYASITKLIVTPRKIINLNDGSKEIRLCVVAYFDNGTIRDVSNECVISNNFVDDLFNETQYITLKFNLGKNKIVSYDVEINIHDNGATTDNKIYYSESILKIDEGFIINSDYKYYRVRNAVDFDFFYTPIYNEVHYDALYTDYSENSKMLTDGKNVIVEFYDADRKLVDSVVMAAYYKENI